MSVYCIIPARKGSKRIPNKNFREFCGEPMVDRAIDLACHVVDLPIVSTDSNLLFDYSRADKLWRDEHCDDRSGLLDVMQDAIFSFSERDILLADESIFVCLLPCTPLLQADTLKRAVESYKAHYAASHEMMVSVCEYPHPLQRSFWLANGSISGCVKQEQNTQDCGVHYHDAGQFYIATAKRWLSGEPILSDGAKPWILPRHEAVDIDTEEDWRLAELIYRGLKCE